MNRLASRWSLQRHNCSLDEGKSVYHQLLILFDNHVKPYQPLSCDLAVTYHVVNDARSNQSAGKRARKSSRLDLCIKWRFLSQNFRCLETIRIDVAIQSNLVKAAFRSISWYNKSSKHCKTRNIRCAFLQTQNKYIIACIISFQVGFSCMCVISYFCRGAVYLVHGVTITTHNYRGEGKKNRLRGK